MVEQILPGLYRIELPLPNSPLKAINSYVITGRDRNLIVDTGMNRDECKDAMTEGLAELGVRLDQCDFFITHMHADHSGLVSSLVAKGAKIYCNQQDAEHMCLTEGSMDKWRRSMDFGRISGFPLEELRDALEKHPGFMYCAKGPLELTLLMEGDVIVAGDYAFKCVETPGHTAGHLCLYDAGKKVLLSGDHILYDITPNISLWSDGHNPLQKYLESLDKIREYDIELVLPGHRSRFRDYRERIDQLKEHHRERAEEVLTILEKGPGNAYGVASEMTWDMTYTSWEQFPVPQKWFAIGEAIAHLKYLEEKQLVRREMVDGKIIYSL